MGIKIDWQKRIKNKTFLVSFFALIISFVYELISLFGFTIPLDESVITSFVLMVLNILGILGVITDPTTEGICDNKK